MLYPLQSYYVLTFFRRGARLVNLCRARPVLRRGRSVFFDNIINLVFLRLVLKKNSCPGNSQALAQGNIRQKRLGMGLAFCAG